MGKKYSPRTSPSPESRFDQGQAMDAKSCFPVRRHMFVRRHARSIVLLLVLLGCLFLIESLIMSLIHFMLPQTGVSQTKLSIGWSKGVAKKGRLQFSERSQVVMYGRLLDMASAVASDQFNGDSQELWEDPYKNASLRWKPCADKRIHKQKTSPIFGSAYIFVTANGGLNQQRVAVCNAVAIASLLNATLVIPRFLYSSVWKDTSQFGDIYQEEHFINMLKDDVQIVKELPSHLQNSDFEAIGSLVTDADISKEAKPIEFVEKVLPILQKNGVVHFLGFGNRLAFDPLPIILQRLRCKCNFHALQFAPKIQKTGSLLVERIRNYGGGGSIMDSKILGNFVPSIGLQPHVIPESSSKYLALHLRFEIDMVAYSMCDFGGGEEELEELQAYRKTHFALVLERMNGTKFLSPKELRDGGRCPLTPEEAALMLSALGYKHDTYIYLAGSKIYGAQSRLLPFTDLYPNLVTKEDLLTPTELASFRNFSSQMAALDFIACATANVFTMTDSGSQFSSLVTGYRTYYGGGQAPSIRPNNKRFAKILAESGTIEWKKFKLRVRKMIEEGQRVQSRRVGRSIYRQPRCSPCMCKK